MRINLIKISIILGMFVMTFGFISCNNDDDTYTEPVIGIWNPYSSNGKVMSECEQKSELTFSANGNYSVVIYTEGADGTCAAQNTEKGVWKNKGNGIYSIQINGHSERNAKVFFSDNNTLSYTSTSVDEGVTTTQVSIIKRKK